MRRLILPSLCLLLTLSTGTLLAESYPLEIDADRSDCGSNLKNCTLSGNVLIRQGDARVTADKLFSRTQNLWELSGNITIDKTGMTIKAQQATIALRQRELESFSLVGSPVNFQYLVGDDSRAKGQADSISFDLKTRIISLDGNAQLIETGNELNGEHIEYNIDAQRLKANNQGKGDGRVHLIFDPPPKDNTLKDSAPKSPQAESPQGTESKDQDTTDHEVVDNKNNKSEPTP